jgi:hypothetical protein
MRWLILLALCAARPCLAVSNVSLAEAFVSVFKMKDSLSDLNSPVIRHAMVQLDKMGIDSSLASLCELPDAIVAQLLMKAALAEFLIGLQDANDWSIVFADAGTGQLTRQRSFSAVRFAVIESLLLVAVAALGRVVWLGNK